MPRIIHRLALYWSTDRSLTAFVILLVVLLFVVAPLYEPRPAGTILFQAVFTLVAISGVMAATRNRMLTILAAAVSAAQILAGWTYVAFALEASLLASISLCIVTVILLVAAVLIQTFREGPITGHRILGAVAVYLLLGLVWGLTAYLIETCSPGSFHVSENLARKLNTFLYHSFVTLTTVGYGDVVPVSDVARSLACVEALTGQLFPAVLIARLVSMELYHRQEMRHGQLP